MEIKGDLNLLLKTKVRIFTKNEDALKFIECLKRKHKDIKPDKYSIVSWD
jgi:hypothetical protein